MGIYRVFWWDFYWGYHRYFVGFYRGFWWEFLSQSWTLKLFLFDGIFNCESHIFGQFLRFEAVLVNHLSSWSWQLFLWHIFSVNRYHITTEEADVTEETDVKGRKWRHRNLPGWWKPRHSDALLEFSEGKTNWWSSAVPKHIPATWTHSQTSKICKHITFGWRRCFLYHDTWPNTTSQIPNPIQRLLGLSYNFPPKSSCTTVHLAGVPWAAPLTLPKLQVLGL